MKKKFKEYLGTLPITKVVINRIDEVMTLNSKLLNDKILDIFVCEIKNHEGSRTYTSLWLFAEKNAIECKNFLQTDDFDITPYFKKLDYCSIKPLNFDFEEVKVNSSVQIYARFGENVFDIVATEQNCIKALDIYKKYIIANLID